jgi:hypothetical protein
VRVFCLLLCSRRMCLGCRHLTPGLGMVLVKVEKFLEMG